MKKPWLYVAIGLIATLVFYFSNDNLRGYLRCDACLGKEIQSPKDSLYQYKLADKAPFKYRILFPTIVTASYKLVFSEGDSVGFYYTYKFWSWLFYVASSCLLFYIMKLAGFSDWLSFTGAVIFILLPPMLMAYTLPVHTREDPLAYTLLFLGLITLLKDKKLFFLFISIVGVLCRETLMLLPMLYFFFSDDKNILRRLAIPAIPAATWLLFRISMGHEEYDVLEGFHWNNNNPDQVVGFLFITFNVCWVTFVFHIINYKQRLLTQNKVRLFFYRSSLLTLVAILLTTYLGGIYNEIRLLYPLAPWMILILLDFVEQHSAQLKKIMLAKGYLTFIVLAAILSAVFMYFALKHQTTLIVPGKYAVPYHLWIIVSIVYFFVTVVFIPVSFKVFFAKRIKNV